MNTDNFQPFTRALQIVTRIAIRISAFTQRTLSEWIMSPRTLFTSEYCPPGHYSPVNNVPPRTCASEVVWPSYFQVSSTTTSSRDHAWTWQQQHYPHTEISLGYAFILSRVARETWVMLRETRYDALSLVPRPSRDQFLWFTEAAKLTWASFPVLTLQAANAGVRTARARVYDSLCIKNTVP